MDIKTSHTTVAHADLVENYRKQSVTGPMDIHIRQASPKAKRIYGWLE